MNPGSFCFCTFAYLSINSLVWILAKLVLALNSSMYALPVMLFSASNKCLNIFETLQVDSCHNLDPQKMICISTLYIDVSSVKVN